MADGPPAGRTASWLLLAAALVLAAAGLVAWRDQERPLADAARTDASAGEASAAAAAALPQPRRLPREPGSPRRLRVPELGVDAPVVPVGTRGDTLVPPTDPQQVGWWGNGAKPGAETGRALLAGHTVSTGGGALDELESLRPGARVVVSGEGGRVAFEVVWVRTFAKGRLTQRSERLFRQDGPSRLVLLTCEDWDGEQYLSNVVVVARPVGR